ncbi:hypothetical protein BOX15_Mlig015185g3 [Macrostomum lignano]|uniref:TPR_REGION domain-containing protein n=1 Tax=Macrostomum lignano TaxID=282301 RepID=A0A267E473_9PLAT|nr:hypothetical protein BOX15_Mlig015185g1 [Macrostomum lignano]PAA73811.1 hypothetical protein BOX15_Mlig015185g3 [Macrostomum lignano]
MASWFSKSPEKLVQSANKLKQQQQWLQAGDEFCEAAVLYKSKDEVEVANCLRDAANCYIKVDERYAIMAMEAAAIIESEQGKFQYSAELHKNIAELALSLDRKKPRIDNWLSIGGALDMKSKSRFGQFGQSSRSMSATRLAVQHLEKAATYFNSEGGPANEADCFAQMAELLADSGDLVEAAEIYDKLVELAWKHEFLALGAKTYAFRACLCRLAAGLELRMDEMEKRCPSLTGSDECTLVKSLDEACDSATVDAAIRQFGRLNQADEWTKRRLDAVRGKRAGPRLA